MDLRIRAAAALWLVAPCIAIAATAHAADATYSTGANDKEVRIGHTTAYSGPVSAFGAGGRTLVAYFNMINEQGGIGGRQIKVFSLDDAYSPPKAVEQTRKLVEQEDVLLIHGVSGSPTNAATQKYLNGKGVPQVLIATGASKFNNPKAFPWTMPFWPSYGTEQKAYVDYIAKAKPGARIAILHANDDYGKDHLAGLVAALKDAKGISLVAQASYESSDATIDSQILALKASGADVFISATTPKFAAQAIRKIREVGWSPMQFVANASSSVSAVLEPAGLENSKGVITGAFLKTPGDPRWADDPEVKDFVAFMKRWNPQDNPYDLYTTTSYVNAVMLHHVLKQAGNNLTRENIMKVVGNIDGLHLPLHLKSIVLKTTPDDFSAFKTLQLQRFDGKTWVDVD